MTPLQLIVFCLIPALVFNAENGCKACGSSEKTVGQNPSIKTCQQLVVPIAIYYDYLAFKLIGGFWSTYNITMNWLDNNNNRLKDLIWRTADYKTCCTIQIEPKRLQIPEMASSTVGHYNYDDDEIQLEDLLKKFSTIENTEDVGIGILLTGRKVRGPAGLNAQEHLGQSNIGRPEPPFVSGMFATISDKGEFKNTAVVSIANNGTLYSNEKIADIIIHELGHLMGASHDYKNNTFIMSPVYDTPVAAIPPTFSPASLKAIETMLNAVRSKLPDARNEPVCPKGIVEPGEDCHPGLNGKNGCCALNCRLLDGVESSWNQKGCSETSTLPMPSKKTPSLWLDVTVFFVILLLVAVCNFGAGTAMFCTRNPIVTV